MSFERESNYSRRAFGMTLARIAGAAFPTGPHDPRDGTLRHRPQRLGIERSQIDHVDGHGVHSRTIAWRRKEGARVACRAAARHGPADLPDVFA